MADNEALRLATWHEAMACEPKRNEAKRDKHRRTAAELRRLAGVEAERDALVKERDEDRRREYGYSQQVVDALTNERGALRAERDAFKTENERLSWIVNAASWHRAQEEHNALRAERDALVDEKYRLRHLLAQARFFVDRAPHGDERDCPVCEFVNRIDAALAEKGGGNG